MWYYIDEDIDGGDDLPVGTRVLVLPKGLPLGEKSAEGPFNSIGEVKSSKMFRQLLKENPKRAVKIFEKRYLHTEIAHLSFYVGGIDSNYEKCIPILLKHSILGETKKQVSGIHLQTTFNTHVRILKESNPDQNGVWKADIEVFNQNSDTWIKKSETTFFPKEWTSTRLISECWYAYNNRRKITDTKFESVTASGVPIVFIYDKDQNLKTVYPTFVE